MNTPAYKNMDYLNELSAHFHGKIKTQHHQDSHFKEISFRKLLINDLKGYKISINEFGELFSIIINVESELALAINKPNRIFQLTKPVSLENLPYIVYTSEDYYNSIKHEAQKTFWTRFIELLKRIQLSENESVIIYRNAICFALNASRNLAPILEDIVNFLTINNTIFKKGNRRIIRSRKVPGNLKPIIPLLKKYSVSDDVERQELIEKMTQKDKIELIKSIDPFITDIDNYLASFNETPLDNEAMLIGNLAELVSELKIKMGA